MFHSTVGAQRPCYIVLQEQHSLLEGLMKKRDARRLQFLGLPSGMPENH